MRRGWFLIAMLLVLSISPAAFQMPGTHINALEPATSSELTLPTDVVLGNCMLQAGVYLVSCDRELVTFRLKSTKAEVLTLPCRGSVTKEKAKLIRAVYEQQPSGVIVLDKLYLKGNNVEHVF